MATPFSFKKKLTGQAMLDAAAEKDLARVAEKQEAAKVPAATTNAHHHHLADAGTDGRGNSPGQGAVKVEAVPEVLANARAANDALDKNMAELKAARSIPVNLKEDHAVDIVHVNNLDKALVALPEYLAAIDLKGLMVRLIEVIATNGTKLDAFRVLMEQAVVINTAATAKLGERVDYLEALLLNMGRVQEPVITYDSTIPGDVNVPLPETPTTTTTAVEKPKRKMKLPEA
jgi:hypothetical protein